MRAGDLSRPKLARMACSRDGSPLNKTATGPDEMLQLGASIEDLGERAEESGAMAGPFLTGRAR